MVQWKVEEIRFSAIAMYSSQKIFPGNQNHTIIQNLEALDFYILRV